MSIMTNFPIAFAVDEMGIIFGALTAIIFIAAGIYSFEYMKGSKHLTGYVIFYVLAAAMEIMACFAANMVTFYMCFELLTITSMPLVLQERTKEGIVAALKYMLFSMFGAYAALFGIFILNKYSETLDFIQGGSISSQVFAENTTLLLWAALALIIGFGVKAGMFPLHSWLPTAHPVAPAPASAVLSAVIVKAGVLGIIRSIFYVFGGDKLRGTWVQYAWMVLALATVFMGSMLAYREPVLKKRLAYSTVSQLSYILFGLSVLSPAGITGGLLHVLGHGFIKAVLFLSAGAIIHHTGMTRVEDMRGIGRKMPLIMYCYTIASLGLIGIPPTGGFISKWYLAMASLQSKIPVFAWLGVVILLISALLTAGYLLQPVMIGFFPGADFAASIEDDDGKAITNVESEKETLGNILMGAPILILTILSVLLGLFPDFFVNYIEQIAGLLV